MAYVGFNDHGYVYFDEGYHLLFSEDNTHEFLFRYVTQDLSYLPEQFGRYIARRMDTSTFALYNRSSDDTLIEQMKSVLVAAHPYYKHEANQVLIQAIGDYFNDLLLYSCYHCHTPISDFSEAWYKERITALLSPLLMLGDTYPEDFYREYQRRIGGDSYTAGVPDSEIETAILGVPRDQPIGLSNELRTQRAIYNMLYFLLDIAAQGLEELTTPQRIWLYGNVVVGGPLRVGVSKQLSFWLPTLYQHPTDQDNQDILQDSEYNRELDDKFHSLHALGKLNVGRDGIPDGMGEDLRSAIDYARTVTSTKLYETYSVRNLYQLLFLEVWSMVQSRIKIRKCRHCGKYFVAATRRIVYCDRVDESGLRCSAVGYQEDFKKKMEDDEPLQIYHRAYKTHHARVRKGTMSKDAFQRWCDEARLKLAKARAGELDIATFQAWLKK